MASLMDEYPMPGMEQDPRELERLKYLTLMRMGLGMAGKEPIGSAMQAGINTMFAGQEDARRNADQRMQEMRAKMQYAAGMKKAEEEKAMQGDLGQIFSDPDMDNARKYMAASAKMAVLGRTEDAKRFADIADKWRTKFNNKSETLKTPDGKIVVVQLSETGEPKVLPYGPAEKLHFATTQDRAGIGLNPYTGAQESSGLPQGMSQADAARIGIERQRLAKEGAGQIVESSDGMVRVTADNRVIPITTGAGELLKGKQPASVTESIAKNKVQISLLDDAVKSVDAYPKAFGAANVTGDFVRQRTDPKGVEPRARISNIGSLKIHDRTGATMAAAEAQRLKPFIPDVLDEAPTVKKKLGLLNQELILMQNELDGGKSIADVAVAPAQYSMTPGVTKLTGSSKTVYDKTQAEITAIKAALERDRLERQR